MNNYGYMPYSPYQNSFSPQPMQFTPMSQIPGRIVGDVSEITASEVPMDGKGVFLKADCSEVYVKQWQPNGTISTLVFKPQQIVAPAETNNDYEAIRTRLEDIYERINDLATPKRTKKEVASERANDD